MLTIEEKQYWSRLIHGIDKLADAVEGLNKRLDENFSKHNSENSEV